MTGGGNGGFNVYKYHYPTSRTKMAQDNVPMGVVGSVELLNSRVISTQVITVLNMRYYKFSFIDFFFI
jgi:hypothetical protein